MVYSIEAAIAYYKHPEITGLLHQVSTTRKLKFFHHAPQDPQADERVTFAAISVFQPAQEDVIPRILDEVLDNSQRYEFPFYPFWGMQSMEVFDPVTQNLIGWDIRFELDYDLQHSFAVLLPIAQFLEYFDIPIILKYSGHRSLHLIIPAESFPIDMKQDPQKEAWVKVFDLFSAIFSRISPHLTTTQVNLSKELIITAPYSLHRYHGLVSLPVPLDTAFSFKPNMADPASLTNVRWPFPDPRNSGEGMQKCIKFLQVAVQNPLRLLKQARIVFSYPRWTEYCEQNLLPSTSPTSPKIDQTLQSLIWGLPGAATLGNGDRIQAACLAMDDPAVKSHNFSGLVQQVVGWHQPIAELQHQRKLRAQLLAYWVVYDIKETLDYILTKFLQFPDIAYPVLTALRIWSTIPTSPSEKLQPLLQRLSAKLSVENLFVLLAIAEVAPSCTDCPPDFAWIPDSPFLVEKDPTTTLQILATYFSPDIVQGIINNQNDYYQLILYHLFQNKIGKLTHAVTQVFAG